MSAEPELAPWAPVTLGQIATINPPKPKYTELSEDDAVGFVPMAAVDEVTGCVADVEPRPLGALRSKSYRTFAPGDVLFAKITPCMENGKAAVVPELPNQHGFGSTEFHVFRPGPDVEPAFLWRFLRRKSFRTEAERHMTGSVGQLRVPVDFLRETQLLLPPLAVQQRLVESLERLDTHRESARRYLGQARKTLADARRGVLLAAVSGRLSAEWRAERGLPDWSTEPATDVCAKVQSGTTPKQWHDSSGVPFLKVYNIVGQELSFDYKPQFISRELHEGTMARATALPGDVLMNIVGPPLGKVAIVTDQYPSWSINQALALFRPSDRVSTEWLYLFLCSGLSVDQVMHETRGSAGQVNISLTQCRNFEIPVPTLEEQNVITRRVKQLLAFADDITSGIESADSAVLHLSEAVFNQTLQGE
jgi:type I restriction enzyme S subunit